METQIANREIVEKLTKLQLDVDTLKIKIEEIKSEDNFLDIAIFSEESLKEVWNNDEDEVWDECVL